jgi:hypothetical protein
MRQKKRALRKKNEKFTENLLFFAKKLGCLACVSRFA